MPSQADAGIFAPGPPTVWNKAPRAPSIAPGTSPPVQPDLEKKRVVLRWDFEDGQSPRELTQGQVVGGPPRAGSLQSALGVISFAPWAGNQYTVALMNGEHFAFSDSQTLTFDYWVGKGVRFIAIQIRNYTQVHSFNLKLPDPVIERWTSVTLRLKDLPPIPRTRPVLAPSARCEPGDAINDILFMAGQVGGPPIYIDNVVVSD
jgi:hypothetical protein